MDSTQEYDWLTVVFIHEPSGQGDTNEAFIRQVRDADHGQNNLLFLIRDSIISLEASSAGPVASFVLTLSILVKNAGGAWEFQQVTDIILDNPDRHCWDTAFRYIYTRYRAKKRMLLTLSHGGGLGINRDFGPVIRPPVKGGVPATGSCQNLEILWSYELADTLTRYLGAVPVDILLMVNCDMQLFDTGYMLRRNIRWMIAPEGFILSPGYDYASLFALLHHFPDTTEANIANRIVNDYRRLSAAAGNEYTSLFATCLPPFEQAAECFREFVELLILGMQAYITRLQSVRANIIFVSLVNNNLSWNSLDLIDMGLWMQQVAAAIPETPRLGTLQADMERLRTGIVREQCIGKKYTDSDQVNIQKWGYSGISIYYPQSRERIDSHRITWCMYFGARIPNPFKDLTNWDLFLEKYFLQITRN